MADELLKLAALYEQQSQNHFVKIEICGQVSNNKVVWKSESDILSIEGIITGGNLSYNGKSSVRRTGSLTMLAFDDNNKITEYDNPIAINKIVKIKIGISSTEAMTINKVATYGMSGDNFVVNFDQIANLEDDASGSLALSSTTIKGYTNTDGIIWQSVGVYVITAATLSRNLSGWNINISIQDQMALLNGTAGGTIADSVTHSPIYDRYIKPGEEIERYPLFTEIIQTLLMQYVGLTNGEIYIWNGGPVSLESRKKASIVIKSNMDDSEWVKNIVSWTGENPLYLQELLTIEEEGKTPYKIYSITQESDNTTTFNYGDSVGYQYVPFTYPTKEQLTSAIGESVASVLEKIKKHLGNYEYFFDVDGIFHFQQIQNGIEQGSSETNLTKAIGESYLVNNQAPVVYSFTSDNMVVSYNNDPQYKNVKNDFVIWGERADTKTPLRYHLIIDSIPSFKDEIYKVFLKTDALGYTRAYNPNKKGEKDETTNIPVSASDWRRHYYFQEVLKEETDDIVPYGAELLQELPKIMNIETGKFYAASEEEQKEEESSSTKLNAIDYFIDILDPQVFHDSKPEVEAALKNFTVTNIGRRTYSKKEADVNCVFSPVFPSLVYIPLGQKDTATLRGMAIKTQSSFVQVTPEVDTQFHVGSMQYAAYDALRVQLNNMLGYANSITIQTMPLYFLDVNQLIYVKDEKTDIEGVFQITSVTVPLAYNGTMSISANKVIKYI